jgi:hypothetical protein
MVVAVLILLILRASVLRADFPLPVGRWPLDEGGGANTVDVSGNDLHGTLIGNPAPLWTSGVSSNALMFDGIQNEVQVGDATVLSPTNALTLSAWVKLATNATGEVIAKWNAGDQHGSYLLSITNGYPALELSLGGVYVLALSDGQLPDTEWHHLVGTYDGTELRIYLDGTLQGCTQATGKVEYVTAPLRLGLPAGHLDNVRIYSVPLNSSEVAALSKEEDADGASLEQREDEMIFGDNVDSLSLDSGARSYADIQNSFVPLSLTSGLVALWELNEGSGTLTADSSGNGHTGTLQGGTSWVTGVSSNTVAFGGTNDLVKVVDADDLDNTTQLSIALWFNASLIDGNPRGLISKRISSNDQQSYTLFLWTGSKLYVDIEGSLNRFESVTVFQTNRWYHIVVTYDGSLKKTERVKLYVNGAWEKTSSETAQSIPNNASDVTLGTLNDGYSYSYKGKLDDVRLYNQVLSTNDIASLYSIDTDGDGLRNVDEANTHGTDPNNSDTDNDGMPDGWEVQYGLNPLSSADASTDLDGDGVANLAEYLQGRDPTKGAEADSNGVVRLYVFTPME